jgi:hypothetical protein
MNELLRQTGRTTRLMEKAVQLARQGRAVYVVVSSRAEAGIGQRVVNKLWVHLHGPRAHGIKVETLKDLGDRFDWEQMRVVGSHPNCEFLLDHYVVEQHIEQLRLGIARRVDTIAKLYPHTV